MADDPNVSNKIQDSAILHGISIQRVTKGMRQAVLDDLVALRDALLAKLNSGKTLTEWQQKRITDLLQFANGTIDQAYQKIGKNFTKDLSGISDAAIKQLKNSVNQAVGVEISAAMSPKQLEAISNTKNLLVQGATQKDWWNKQSEDLQGKFSQTVKMGMMQGKSIGEMTKPVSDLMQNSSAQAEALLRTAVATVQSEAQQSYYENNDDIIKGVQWVSTLDSRTTPVCQALSGLTWTYDADQSQMTPVGHEQKWLGYPPVHFNCRSTTIPVLRSWAELSSKKLAQADDQTVAEVFQDKLQGQGFSAEEASQIQQNQQASLDGQVADSLTYEQWLKSKPEEFQKQVLGQQRWQLWQDGKLNLMQMIDGNGHPLSIAELQHAAANNIAVPISKAQEGENGLTLAERAILQAMRTDAAVNGQYHTTWLDETGKTIEQTLTHSLTEEEHLKLTAHGEEHPGREVEQPKLIHLSNSLKENEFWDPSEMKIWASIPGFTEAKLVTINGKVFTAKLKAGKLWTLEDVKTYEDAYPDCKAKEKYPWQAVNCAFKKTGKLALSITKPDAVKLDPSSLKAVYPPLKEKPAPYFTPQGPTPEEMAKAKTQAELEKANSVAQAMAEQSQQARQMAAQRSLALADQMVAAHEQEASEAKATIAKHQAEVEAAEKAALAAKIAAEKAEQEAIEKAASEKMAIAQAQIAAEAHKQQMAYAKDIAEKAAAAAKALQDQKDKEAAEAKAAKKLKAAQKKAQKQAAIQLQKNLDQAKKEAEEAKALAEEEAKKLKLAAAPPGSVLKVPKIEDVNAAKEKYKNASDWATTAANEDAPDQDLAHQAYLKAADEYTAVQKAFYAHTEHLFEPEVVTLDEYKALQAEKIEAFKELQVAHGGQNQFAVEQAQDKFDAAKVKIAEILKTQPDLDQQYIAELVSASITKQGMIDALKPEPLVTKQQAWLNAHQGATQGEYDAKVQELEDQHEQETKLWQEAQKSYTTEAEIKEAYDQKMAGEGIWADTEPVLATPTAADVLKAFDEYQKAHGTTGEKAAYAHYQDLSKQFQDAKAAAATSAADALKAASDAKAIADAQAAATAAQAAKTQAAVPVTLVTPKQLKAAQEGFNQAAQAGNAQAQSDALDEYNKIKSQLLSQTKSETKKAVDAEQAIEAHEAALAQQQAAAAAAQAAKYIDGFPADPGEVTPVKGTTLGGTTGAQLVKDDEGNLYIMKTGSGAKAAHIASEVSTDLIYRKMGIDVPEPHLYNTSNGVIKLSKFVEGKQLNDYLATASASQKKLVFANLQHGFVMDALLANWDVVGLNRDNILVDTTGKVYRIDNGSGLEYRAQGTKKTAAQFTGDVVELKTFLDGSNPRTAEVFTGITQEQITDQIKEIAANRKTILDAAPDAIKPILAQRIDYLMKYANVTDADLGVGTWASHEDVVKKIEPTGVNGYSIASDRGDIEDTEALVWTLRDKQGKTQTVTQVKLREDASQKLEATLSAWLPKTAQTAKAMSNSGDQYFGTIESAVKTINHHISQGDIKYNAGTVANALSLKGTLKNLELQGGTNAVMAKTYLEILDKIQASIDLTGGKLIQIDQVEMYTPPKVATPKAPVQAGSPWPITVEPLEFKASKFDKGKAQETGGSAFSFYGSPIQYSIDMGDVQVKYVPAASNNSVRSLVGTMRLTGASEPSPEMMGKIQNALKDLGIDVTPPTDEYRKSVYLVKNIYIQNKSNVPADVEKVMKDDTISDADKLARIDKAAKKFGIVVDPTDTRWQGDGRDGREVYWRSDLTEAQIKKEWPDGVITHDLWYNGDSSPMSDYLERFFKSGGELTPNTERIRKGVPKTGGSPDADLGTGGSSYWFNRLSTVGRAKSISTASFIFDIKNIARTDAWSFGGDVFGAVMDAKNGKVRGHQRAVTIADFKANQSSNPRTNEIDFKNGFDILKDVKYIVVADAKDIPASIAVLHKYGITKWPDGRPLSQVVVTGAGVTK